MLKPLNVKLLKDKKFIIGSICIPVILAVIGWAHERPSYSIGNITNNEGIITQGQHGDNYNIVRKVVSPNEWQPLADEEIVDLESKLREIDPLTRSPLAIRCNTNSAGCKKLAASFAEAFERVSWPKARPNYFWNAGNIQDSSIINIEMYGAGDLERLKNIIAQTTSLEIKTRNPSQHGATVLYIGNKE